MTQRNEDENTTYKNETDQIASAIRGVSNALIMVALAIFYLGVMTMCSATTIN